MLISSSELISFPVLSLRTGGRIAQVENLIVNPYNLSTQAFKLKGYALENPKDSYLLPRDVREISRLGIIIDDSEEIVRSADIIKLRQIIELDFKLVGLPVFDQHNRRVGRVTDFTLDHDDLLVYQLVVKRPFLKDLLDPELLIHRSQIAELSQHRVTIKGSLDKLQEIERQVAIDHFVNPFRSKKPAKETD